MGYNSDCTLERYEFITILRVFIQAAVFIF